ncbi:hypothetical protein LCGC14_1478210 [marine sediment metagenome]|uniref:SpoVT-AbrB domain-containing protein n=1 Tax=marine sediment metagenome TaxID=412755 RepID=A0A0F9LQM8_9ZZZZ
MVIVKLHKQHTSVVMTVPKILCKALGLCAGDYVIIEQVDSSQVATLQKFIPEDIRNVREKRNPDRKNKDSSA